MGARKLTGGGSQKWQRLLRQLKQDAFIREVGTGDLAEMAGLNRGIITHWVTHNQRPRTKNWDAIQKVLQTLPVKLKYPETVVIHLWLREGGLWDSDVCQHPLSDVILGLADHVTGGDPYSHKFEDAYLEWKELTGVNHKE